MIYGHPRIEEFVYAFPGIFGDFGHRAHRYVDTEFRYVEYLLFRKLFLPSFQHCHDFCHKGHLYPVLDVGFELDLPCRRNHSRVVPGSYPVRINVYFDRRTDGRILTCMTTRVSHRTNKIDLKI
jgi:hypothetical protein